MRYAAKRDTAEQEIVASLMAVGAKVYRMDRPVDLLVRYRGTLTLLEVKTPKASTDARQVAQRLFVDSWQVPIVKTPLDALTAIGVICA